MVKVIQVTAGCAGKDYQLEDLTMDGAPGTDSGTRPKAAIPNSATQRLMIQPIAVPTSVRIRLDTERLISQAGNDDERLAILAAINRFYAIVFLGATDRR